LFNEFSQKGTDHIRDLSSCFHLGGLLADSLQTHPDPTNDQAFIAQGVGLYVWVLFTVAISLIGVGAAYFFRLVARLLGRVHTSKKR
jgi:hypothetical protein